VSERKTNNKFAYDSKGDHQKINSQRTISTISVPLYVFPVPPKWLHEPEDVMAVEGHDVVIPCLVEGYPHPVIRWERENADVAVAYQQHMMSGDLEQKFPNGSLLLTQVRRPVLYVLVIQLFFVHPLFPLLGNVWTKSPNSLIFGISSFFSTLIQGVS
jgi:hypothetical protein